MNKILQIASSRRTWAWPYILFMLLFVVLPLILVGVYAFTDIDGHFTVRNFAKFFSHSEAIQTFLARPGSLSIRSEDPAQLMPWIQFLDPAALGRMLAITATPGEKSLPEQMKALMAR